MTIEDVKKGSAVAISGILLAAVLIFGIKKAPQHGFSYISPLASPSATLVATPSATLAPSGLINGPCRATHVNPNDPQAYLPDSYCTPGVINPQVTQQNLSSTVCKAGFTSLERPSVSYTENLKRTQMAEYGFTGAISNYEEDHFISLELGGSPTDPRNLWPEPGASVNEKDKVEDYLHAQVCRGALTLAAAQKEIATNWYTVYQLIK